MATQKVHMIEKYFQTFIFKIFIEVIYLRKHFVRLIFTKRECFVFNFDI